MQLLLFHGSRGDAQRLLWHLGMGINAAAALLLIKGAIALKKRI